MPYRLTKIYTRTGDEGSTTLRDQRLPKDDILVEALGTIDELNSSVGLITALGVTNKEIAACLTQIQHQLFDIGGELHCPQYIKITSICVEFLESIIDKWNATLTPLTEFVLPQGHVTCVAAHFARTVCRRAERRLVTLNREVPLNNPEILRYINRLSDFLFVLARILTHEHTEKEILWNHVRAKK